MKMAGLVVLIAYSSESLMCMETVSYVWNHQITSNISKVAVVTAVSLFSYKTLRDIYQHWNASTEKKMIKHLACIMDGNRRWARQKGWLPWVGHRQGAQAVKNVVDFCLEKNIPYLSLYTFSIENFKRPAEELNYLFDLMIEESDALLEQYIAKGVCVRFIGDRTLFPEKIRPTCERIEQATAHLSTLHLNFLFCYGGRQEIIGGIKQIIGKIKTGELVEDQLTDELFAQCLWTAGMPEPDMILRTGGAKRLSNFLLYQAAYAECYFIDCLWPELTKKHLERAMVFFQETQRNYGT